MPSSGSTGNFIPTTQVWDVSEIYATEVTSPAFKELLVRLYQNLNRQAVAVNSKDTGIYDTLECANGQAFFPNPLFDSTTQTYPAVRQVYRKVVNFGALPNTALKTVSHGLTVTTGFTVTRVYGAATDPVNKLFLPIPYSSPVLANNIELNIDATNVNITTGSNRAAYTVTYVIFEYLKQ